MALLALDMKQDTVHYTHFALHRTGNSCVVLICFITILYHY